MSRVGKIAVTRKVKPKWRNGSKKTGKKVIHRALSEDLYFIKSYSTEFIECLTESVLLEGTVQQKRTVFEVESLGEREKSRREDEKSEHIDNLSA